MPSVKGWPCATKSLSIGLIYSPVFVFKGVHEIAALSFWFVLDQAKMN